MVSLELAVGVDDEAHDLLSPRLAALHLLPNDGWPAASSTTAAPNHHRRRHFRTNSHEIALVLACLGNIAPRERSYLPKRARQGNSSPQPQEQVQRSALGGSTGTPPVIVPASEPPVDVDIHEWPPELRGPLPQEVVEQMLFNDAFLPGPRPLEFMPSGRRFVFKERHGERPTGVANNRWHNSGGRAGARDMILPARPDLKIRRRYGSITARGTILWRYHEYCVARRVEAAGTCSADLKSTQWVEDRTVLLFHIMPRRTHKGRPRKGEEAASGVLWRLLAPNLAWSTAVGAQSEPEGACATATATAAASARRSKEELLTSQSTALSIPTTKMVPAVAIPMPTMGVL